MKVRDIVKAFNLKVLAEGEDREITGGYTSDLLSNVMAHAEEGNLWITVQRHMNIIAVAQLKKISAIIIANGGMPDSDVINKAKDEGIFLLQSNEGAFELSGKIYNLLIEKSDL